MQNNLTAPPNKKEYIKNLANGLVKSYGKKKFYTPDEVASINREFYPAQASAYERWGMSIFCTHHDFFLYEKRNDPKKISGRSQ